MPYIKFSKELFKLEIFCHQVKLVDYENYIPPKLGYYNFLDDETILNTLNAAEGSPIYDDLKEIEQKEKNKLVENIVKEKEFIRLKQFERDIKKKEKRKYNKDKEKINKLRKELESSSEEDNDDNINFNKLSIKNINNHNKINNNLDNNKLNDNSDNETDNSTISLESLNEYINKLRNNFK